MPDLPDWESVKHSLLMLLAGVIVGLVGGIVLTVWIVHVLG